MLRDRAHETTVLLISTVGLNETITTIRTRSQNIGLRNYVKVNMMIVRHPSVRLISVTKVKRQGYKRLESIRVCASVPTASPPLSIFTRCFHDLLRQPR